MRGFEGFSVPVDRATSPLGRARWLGCRWVVHYETSRLMVNLVPPTANANP